MDKKDETRPGSLPAKGLNRINRNILVFAFFLLLSFIFWYLNSLGKEIETSVKYPVTYKNIPDEGAIDGELPSRLKIMLSGYGYSILSLKISANQLPLVIDFSETGLRHAQKGGQNYYYLITTGLITDFNTQLKSECKIISIKPDTLFFSLK